MAMDTITIMTPPSYSLSDFQCHLSKYWQVESAYGDRIFIQEDDSRLYLYEDKNFKNLIKQEWACSQELRSFFDEAGDANFFLLDYSDLGFVKKVLPVIADNHRIVIDNEFGTVMRGNDFVEKLRTNSNWNWREKVN